MNENMPRSGDASQGMSNVRETVREKAAGLAEGAKQQARSQYEQKKQVARGELDTLASALRRAGSEVSDNGGMSGRVITTVADRIDSLGRSIEGKDLDGVIHEVERFARRNPAAFLGAAVAVGVLASRFLKSSTSRAFDVDDYYSSEAYGGFRDSRADSAIGSTGYGSTSASDLFTSSSGYGTTYGSELDSRSTLDRSSTGTPGARSTSGTGLDTESDFGIGNSGRNSGGTEGR
jgi:hypothetical protein